MARVRVAAAGAHTLAASFGPMRAVTADRPCARDHKALGSIVLLIALMRMTAMAVASFGSRRAVAADRARARPGKAFGFVLLAWVRASSASFGCRRSATADRLSARGHRSSVFVVL